MLNKRMQQRSYGSSGCLRAYFTRTRPAHCRHTPACKRGSEAAGPADGAAASAAAGAAEVAGCTDGAAPACEDDAAAVVACGLSGDCVCGDSAGVCALPCCCGSWLRQFLLDLSLRSFGS